jgi:hypothetical protein
MSPRLALGAWIVLAVTAAVPVEAFPPGVDGAGPTSELVAWGVAPFERLSPGGEDRTQPASRIGLRPEATRLALAPSSGDGFAVGRGERRSSISNRRGHPGLGVERARILLQSLTVPGWGQASLGRRTSAKIFAVAEVGVWASFTSFRIQEQLRRLTYERTAQLFAGIDLRSRDEEFRRIVGQYPSSDEYNRLVVRRDAANLYYGDPAAYNQYIAEHQLSGADTWAWVDEESYRRYGDERKRSERAALRANTALALAIANRLVSAIHAARYAGGEAAAPRSWNLECVPAGGDPTAFQLGVRVRF